MLSKMCELDLPSIHLLGLLEGLLLRTSLQRIQVHSKMPC